MVWPWLALHKTPQNFKKKTFLSPCVRKFWQRNEAFLQYPSETQASHSFVSQIGDTWRQRRVKNCSLILLNSRGDILRAPLNKIELLFLCKFSLLFEISPVATGNFLIAREADMRKLSTVALNFFFLDLCCCSVALGCGCWRLNVARWCWTVQTACWQLVQSACSECTGCFQGRFRGKTAMFALSIEASGSLRWECRKVLFFFLFTTNIKYKYHDCVYKANSRRPFATFS